MQVELKRIQRQVGITFIYVTHDQEEALTMSDRLAVFRDGRIEQIGRPTDVYERPATEFVASLRRHVERDRRADAAGRSCDPRRSSSSSGAAPAGRTGAAGRVVDVAYLGMITRYTVELD